MSDPFTCEVRICTMNKLRSIADFQKKSLGEMFGMYVREPWYFEQWYEKVILILMGIFGWWKILGWIF